MSQSDVLPLYVVQGQGLSKHFWLGKNRVNAVRGVDLAIRRATSVAFTGNSGCGKSTLLNLLGCVDQPSAGQIWINGQNTSDLTEFEKSKLRCESIGFIFQTFNLLPVFTALENVAYPLLLLGTPPKERMERARRCLNEVGLSGHENHRPADLSGGQRQRVAIARALVKEPALIIADEPSANLDRKNTEQILELLLSLQKSHHTALVVASHDPILVAGVDEVKHMEDGRFVNPSSLREKGSSDALEISRLKHVS